MSEKIEGGEIVAANWARIYRRIESVQKAIEQGWEPTPEAKRSILRERARLLAREPEADQPQEEHLEVVEFLLAYERYGVESSYVREVYPLKELVRLPCAPGFVLGLINLRGRILSIIDIKKFFDLPEKGLTDLNKIIVVSWDKMELGILADLILGLRSIPTGEIQPSLPTLTGIRQEYLKGVAGDRTIILDAGKLLSDKKIIVHQEVEV